MAAKPTPYIYIVWITDKMQPTYSTFWVVSLFFPLLFSTWYSFLGEFSAADLISILQTQTQSGSCIECRTFFFHLAECKWSVSFFSNTLPETDELNAHLVAYRCCACRVWEGQESAINQVFFVLRVGLNTYIILQAVLFLPCYKVHKCGRMFSELAGK